MSFLPENYQEPKSSNHFMKLQDGENRIRILSKPILGWEDWTAEKKPVRFQMDAKPKASIDPKKPIRHFWCFLVWNYSEQLVQVLHLTQATIRSCVKALTEDTEWGAPYFYDIKIVKKGEGVDTEYMVNPVPHKPLPDDVKKAFYSKRCQLDAIYDNGDPFSNLHETYTDGIFDRSDLEKEEPTVSAEDDIKYVTHQMIEDLEKVIGSNQDYRKAVMERLKKLKIEGLEKIPLDLYKVILNDAKVKKEAFMKKLEAEAFDGGLS